MVQFLLLPLEVLFSIVELLDAGDLKKLRYVSRRVSSVAARFQFRRVVLNDPTGRRRIKKAFEILEPYVFRTRSLHVAACFPHRRPLDDNLITSLLTRPINLKHLILTQNVEQNHTQSYFPRANISLLDLLPRSLTHLKLSGIRLTPSELPLTLFSHFPNLISFTLDLSVQSRHAKYLYSETEAIWFVDRLGFSCRNLKTLTLSVGDVSFHLLERIAKRLWAIEELHLVGADTDGVIPTTGLYLRDVTHDFGTLALILSKLHNLRALSLPYFLGAPLSPLFLTTLNPHHTLTTFYLPPPHIPPPIPEFNPDLFEPGFVPPIPQPGDIVPTNVDFPALREACGVLKMACRELEYVMWAAPGQCFDERLAVVGPFATRVVAWGCREVELDDESVVDGDMVENRVITLWDLCARRVDNVELICSGQA